MGGQKSLPAGVTSLNVSDKGLRFLPFKIPRYHPLGYLNGSGNQLVKLPRRLENIKTLILDRNKLDRIPSALCDAIESYKNLSSLSLCHNSLEEFDLCMESLETLSVANNLLSEIPKIAQQLVTLNADFNRITVLNLSAGHLERLSLSQNIVKEISFETHLPMLLSLDLSMNELRDLPDNISAICPCLQSLNISFNILTKLTSQMPETLVTLNASFNEIDTISNHICNLGNLTTLNLEQNRLKKLPTLPGSIKTLILDGNQLEQCDPSSFRDVVQLNFSGNNMKEIPLLSCNTNICSFSQNLVRQVSMSRIGDTTKTLDLSHCMLESVPPSLFRLPQLVNLFLQANKLEEIPDTFSSSIIQSLNVSHNKLTKLPPFPHTLESIYASFNDIESIDDMCIGCDALTTVVLSNAKLTHVPRVLHAETLFLSQNAIETIDFLPDEIHLLDLSLNKIQEFPRSLIRKNLREIDISHNQITEFPDVISSELEFVKLQGNPIHGCLDFSQCHNLDTVDITRTQLQTVYLDRFVRERLCSIPDADIRTWKYTAAEKSGYAEMLGIRPTMEDSIIVRDDIGLYLVCDGHGGADTSTYAARKLAKCLSGADQTVETVKKAFAKTQNNVVKYEFDDGSTAVLCWITEAEFIIANLGDARCLIISKDGEIRFATEDHKPYERSEWMRIKEEGGYVSRMRVSGILAVSRSFGDTYLPGVGHIPDISTIPRSESDKFVIVACDGVFDVLKNEEIAQLCMCEDDPNVLAYRIRNLAFSLGSEDNISVIVRSLV